MPISARIVDLSPNVRAAFDEACLAIFKTRVQRSLAGREPRDLLLRFSGHYKHLSALPRRMRRALERRWKCTLSAIALLMTLGQVPAFAAIMQVAPNTPPSINADGKCSLIEAIVNANRNARTHLDCVAGEGPDTIVLPETSQQQLNGQQMLPQITSPIVIEGHQSTILRNWNTSVSTNLAFFRVSASGDLTLNETTVSGATATAGTYGVGVLNAGGVIRLDNSSIVDTKGGLQNTGTAVLENSAVSDNGSFSYYIGRAGGITNDAGGALTLRNCVLTGNSSYVGSGGIYNNVNATATVIDSIVSQNGTNEGLGGGISNRGTLILVGSTVSDNGADLGGGIFNVRTGTATVIRSTISGNSAHTYNSFAGGGIHNGGTLTLTNSTVSNNEGNFGGAGVNNSGELTMVSSTVTGNFAGYEGAGLFVSYGGTVTLKRSIVSGNHDYGNPSGREITIFDGAVTADDYNVFGHDGDAGIEGFTPGVTDIVPNAPIDGILLPLADNGGGTRTHALAIGSPALDASPDDATCPATDQRGNPRPRGPACDIGSFEGSAVLCAGRVTTMVGTVGPDDLTGTPGTDVISGLSGDDDIAGLGGNDLICAGGGADSVFGSSGNDLLIGQGGNDRLFGHSGNDTLNGGPGQDQCDGGTGAGDTAAACETVSNVP